MIRVSKDKKKIYKSLGISVIAKDWDFKKEEPRITCPNRDLILNKLEQKKIGYRNKIFELSCLNKNFIARLVINSVYKPTRNINVKEFINEIV
jgi:hypothetical protein